MARFNGTTVILDVDGAVVAQVEDSTLTINRELPEANDKDSAPWANHLDEGGLQDWEISFDGNADWTDTTGNASILFAILTARTGVTVIFGQATGMAFSGTASFNNVELGAPVEETAPISGTAVGQGALTKITNS